MKALTLFIFLITTLQSFAGVGGSEGGPGATSWAPAIEKGYLRDWPHVRLSQSRTIEIHEVCIQDDATLRTLKKYGQPEVFSLSKKNRKYKTIDRVFDPKNCYSAWDPKCAFVNQYIDDQVKVPVYRGQIRYTRDGPETIRDFVSRSSLEHFETHKIPQCKN